MVVENGKIVRVTDEELYGLYLSREMWEIMPYSEYKAHMEIAGCVVEGGE